MQRTEGLERVQRFVDREQGLAFVVTRRRDGSPQLSLVNVGIVAHPTTGEPRVALVARGGSAKLRNLRRAPQATIAFRAGWDWLTVSGDAELVGPDDPADGVDPEALRQLLRDVYHAAGGRHDDLEEYDRAMAADRRAAVLVAPERFVTNPGR